MTEAWTGRKYRTTDESVAIVLSEPFEVAGGRKWVAYQRPGIIAAVPISALEELERIIAPKYAVGDKVRHRDGDILTIDAASSVPDFEGDFIYIVIDASGKADTSYESVLAGKVSE